MVPLNLARITLGVGERPRVIELIVMLNGVNMNPVAAPMPRVTPAGMPMLMGVASPADNCAYVSAATPAPACTDTGSAGHVVIGPERKKSPGPEESVSNKVPGEPGGLGGDANVIANGGAVEVAVDGAPRAGASSTPARVGEPAGYTPPRSKSIKPIVYAIRFLLDPPAACSTRTKPTLD
jgi:hypothetical protein